MPKDYRPNLQTELSSFQADTHTCCKCCMRVCSTFFCINEIIHVEAEIFSKEVCSLRLFSGNEVGMCLSADSVCVSPLKQPICGFGGK